MEAKKESCCQGPDKMLKLRVLICMFGLLVSVSSGCGSASKEPTRVPVAGTITLDGVPLEGADIWLYGEGEERAAKTDKDGYYQVVGGAQVLKYKVVISKMEGLDGVVMDPEMGMDMGQLDAMNLADNTGKTAEKVAKQLLPKKYCEYATTELTVTIPLEGTQSADFTLTSK